MSSLPADITVPCRSEVVEVSAGIYAYIRPDGSKWTVSTARQQNAQVKRLPSWPEMNIGLADLSEV